MSSWKWSPERNLGIWRCGAGWMRPFMAAVPWLTVGLLMMMFALIGGTFTSARGVLFDLPEGDLAEGEVSGLVAIMMPMPHETLVFFDDARYMLGDAASVAALKDHLSSHAHRAARKTLLVLADRRVAGGELMHFAAIARKGGIEKVLFAERKAVRPE